MLKVPYFNRVVLSCRSLWDPKVIHIHPFWLRFCLPPTFSYAGLDPDAFEADLWPQSTKNDNFSKIKNKKNQLFQVFSKFKLFPTCFNQQIIKNTKNIIVS